MPKIFPPPVRGSLSFLGMLLNTVFWFGLLMLTALLKLVSPFPAGRRFFSRCLNGIAEGWIAVNNLNLRALNPVRWEVQGMDGLKPDEWYLVISNHQTWADILVLQKIFNHRIPLLKFFLKQELIWVPFLGLAWWALDFPFMKRYSEAYLGQHPEARGQDLEITRRACEKFKTIPVSVMNFVEGTRFTAAKHRRQQSPYRHLLKTKAGGIAFVMAAMGEQIHWIVNVTIVYPQGAKGLWAFLCGEVPEIKVRVETLPVTPELRGDYFQDQAFRENFQGWLNRLWAEKVQLIQTLLAQPQSPAR